MSKKMGLLLFIVCLAIGFIAVSYYYDHNLTLIRAAWTWLLTIPTQISTFISNPTGAIATVGAIGTATTGAVTLYSKLKTTKQQATEAIGQVSGELQTARSQASQLKADYDSLRVNSQEAITKLEGEKLALQTRATELEGQLAQKEAEVQKQIQATNMEADMAARVIAQQAPCRKCNKPILPGQRFCQYCGTELIIA